MQPLIGQCMVMLTFQIVSPKTEIYKMHLADYLSEVLTKPAEWLRTALLIWVVW